MAKTSMWLLWLLPLLSYVHMTSHKKPQYGNETKDVYFLYSLSCEHTYALKVGTVGPNKEVC